MVEKVASTLEEVITLALQLSPLDRVRLVERVVSTLAQEVYDSPQPSRRSLYGLWADLKVDVSVEDIDEARREMWGSFPQEDIS